MSETAKQRFKRRKAERDRKVANFSVAGIQIESNTDPNGFDRIDLLVVEYDNSKIEYAKLDNDIKVSKLKILTGTPTKNPIAETPHQIAGMIWQTPIARIWIDNHAVVIHDEDILYLV